ncbi:MAG: fatty acid desaturase [Cyanobacteria bacterium P01_F01_bin.143]
MSHESTEVSSPMGLVIAIAIILFWFISLIELLILDISQMPLVLIILGVFVRSFLHTGLFITTHEAIHGLVSSDRQLNNAIGHFTSFLYALLLYKVLKRNHRLHHRYPASSQDPDFHASNNFWLWYLNFMREYHKGRQAGILVIGMAIIFGLLICLQISPTNIFLFWVIPLIVSSLQLFTFGIFLPHRQEEEDYSNKPSWHYRDRHRAKTIDYSVFWSFITCFHFGYHWEHHQYPYLPWYKLPLVHQQQKNFPIFQKKTITPLSSL